MIETLIGSDEAAQKRRLEAIDRIEDSVSDNTFPYSTENLLARVSAVNWEAAAAIVGIAYCNPNKVNCRYVDYRPGKCTDTYGEKALEGLAARKKLGGIFSIEIPIAEGFAKAAIKLYQEGWRGPIVELSAYCEEPKASERFMFEESGKPVLMRAATIPFRAESIGVQLQDEDRDLLSKHLFGKTKPQYPSQDTSYFPLKSGASPFYFRNEEQAAHPAGNKGLYYGHMRSGLLDLLSATTL